MRRIVAAFSLLAAWAWSAHAGFVRTLDGKSYGGEVRFAANGDLVVNTTNRGPVTVPLRNLLHAVFSATAAATSVGGLLPDGWKAVDIGPVRLPGSAGFSGDQWALQVGGAEIGGNADALHFVHTRLAGDGEISARVTRIRSDDSLGRGGIMFRETLQPESRFAAWLVKADGSCTFRQRSSAGASVASKFTVQAAAPCWIKLTRKKNQFAAFKSADGRNWEQAGASTLELPGNALVGLAVASRNPSSLGVVTMEKARLTRNGLWGEYFAGEDFRRPQFTRVDPLVDFGWGLDSPGAGLESDHFSVRWTGQVEPKFSENYAFYFDADDEAQLWIDGQVVPRTSFKKGDSKPGKTFPLQAGRRHDVKMEYREGGGSASVRLGWSSPSLVREIIPASRLYCTVEPKVSANATNRAAPPQASVPARGILLRNGSFLAGNVQSVGDTSLKFACSGGKQITVFTHNVAWIVFRRPKRPQALENVAGHTGVLLENGDFYEGEIKSIKDRSVKVSSVLFGLKSFPQDSGEVAAWILGDITPQAPLCELRTADGSVFMAKSLAVDKDQVVVTDELLGPVNLAPSIITELKRNMPK